MNFTHFIFNFLGGLIVLFIYIASLASNEKFFLEAKIIIWILTALTLFCLLFAVNINDQIIGRNFINEPKMLINMYISSTAISTGITIIYLLLTLIIVVKITSKYERPLRNIIYNK